VKASDACGASHEFLAESIVNDVSFSQESPELRVAYRFQPDFRFGLRSQQKFKELAVLLCGEASI